MSLTFLHVSLLSLTLKQIESLGVNVGLDLVYFLLHDGIKFTVVVNGDLRVDVVDPLVNFVPKIIHLQISISLKLSNLILGVLLGRGLTAELGVDNCEFSTLECWGKAFETLVDFGVSDLPLQDFVHFLAIPPTTGQLLTSLIGNSIDLDTDSVVRVPIDGAISAESLAPSHNGIRLHPLVMSDSHEPRTLPFVSAKGSGAPPSSHLDLPISVLVHSTDSLVNVQLLGKGHRHNQCHN
jgi:hypothetical protein